MTQPTQHCNVATRSVSFRQGWHGETPLWYYVLREADAREGGQRLSPIGSRIVS